MNASRHGVGRSFAVLLVLGLLLGSAITPAAAQTALPTLEITADPATTFYFEPVVFTFTVTNTTEIAFTDVALTSMDPCPTSWLTGPETGDDDVLDPGETWVWTCAVDTSPSDHNVHGWLSVTDSDGITGTVEAHYLHDGVIPIVTEMTASGTDFVEGELVTYTLVITNRSNTDLDVHATFVYVVPGRQQNEFVGFRQRTPLPSGAVVRFPHETAAIDGQRAYAEIGYAPTGTMGWTGTYSEETAPLVVTAPAPPAPEPNPTPVPAATEVEPTIPATGGGNTWLLTGIGLSMIAAGVGFVRPRSVRPTR
jgi:hypothetical protein